MNSFVETVEKVPRINTFDAESIGNTIGDSEFKFRLIIRNGALRSSVERLTPKILSAKESTFVFSNPRNQLKSDFFYSLVSRKKT